MNMRMASIARYLILLTSAVLTFFGLGTILRIGGRPEMVVWYAFYALIMFVDGAILLFGFFQLKKQNKKIYWLTFIVLLFNVIMPIFDQIGMIDILFMLLNLASLLILYFSRKAFLPAQIEQ